MGGCTQFRLHGINPSVSNDNPGCCWRAQTRFYVRYCSSRQIEHGIASLSFILSSETDANTQQSAPEPAYSALFPAGPTGHHVHLNTSLPHEVNLTGLIKLTSQEALSVSDDSSPRREIRLPQTTMQRSCTNLPVEPISTEVVFGGEDEKIPPGYCRLRQKTGGVRYRYFHLATLFLKADIAGQTINDPSRDIVV